MAHPVQPIKSRKGTVLLLTVFAVAFVSILITGFLIVSTTDLQIVRNNQYSKRALYIAEAGIEDAIYELYQDKHWDAGFTDKAFAGDAYTVTVTNNFPDPVVVDSVSAVGGSFQRHIQVQLTIQGANPPAIDYWKEI